MQCPSSRDAMTCNGRSSDLLSNVGKHLPGFIFTSGISLPMRDNLQLRDSSGISPLSLFNHVMLMNLLHMQRYDKGER